MLLSKIDSINLDNLKCFNIQKINKSFFIIPVFLNQEPLYVQTPLLNLPFGINTIHNKTYVKLQFPALPNKKQYEFLQFLWKLEKHIYENKFKKIWTKLRKKPSGKNLKSSVNQKYNSQSGPIFTSQISGQCDIYNYKNIPIKINDVKENSYVKTICMLNGLWVHNKTIGFLWTTLQVKTYLAKPRKTCWITDNTELTVSDKNTVECPCCSYTINIKQNNKIINNQNDIKIKKTILSPSNNKYLKYFNMKKMGVPISAIYHKIKMDNFSVETFQEILKNPLKPVKSQSQSIKTFNPADFLKQKVKLKKHKKIKKSKPTLSKKEGLVISLQDILKSKSSLKQTGKKLY